jgi:hypothetical protein
MLPRIAMPSAFAISSYAAPFQVTFHAISTSKIRKYLQIKAADL